jgi:hypothetical protein
MHNRNNIIYQDLELKRQIIIAIGNCRRNRIPQIEDLPLFLKAMFTCLFEGETYNREILYYNNS